MSRSFTRRGALFWGSFGALTVVTLFWAVFALLSGAAEYGGGLHGLLRNFPNVVPWLVLIMALVLAYRYPIAGGMVFVAAGALSLIQFDTYRHIATFALITLPYLLLGALLVYAGWRQRRR